jgi:hypothetical protein
MSSIPSASAQDISSHSATLVGLTTQEAEALLSKFRPNDPASTRRGLLAFELLHLFLAFWSRYASPARSCPNQTVPKNKSGVDDAGTVFFVGVPDGI